MARYKLDRTSPSASKEIIEHFLRVYSHLPAATRAVVDTAILGMKFDTAAAMTADEKSHIAVEDTP